MTHKRMKTEQMEINYKFACRCCLKSEAEFFKLDSLTDSGGTGVEKYDASSKKLPLIRLLLFCMRSEKNIPELPQYICVDCSKSLQISYFFIQNAQRAHEILCHKLCPSKLTNSTRLNGQQEHTQLPETNYQSDKQKPKPNPLRHECKVCGAIIYNRLDLKQHIRMHTEESRHRCKLCTYVTFKQKLLPEHYRKTHGLTATQIEQQLKIRKSLQAAANATNTSESAVDDGQVRVCTVEDMELLIPTVLTPEDFSQPQLDADQLRDIEQQLAKSVSVSGSSSAALPAEPTLAPGGSGNMSIGAEFLVMPDGSLQQVNDAGVVFEYIDDSKSANTSTNMSLQSLLSDVKTNVTYDTMNMDMNQLVVQEALPQITVRPKQRPGPGSIAALKHKCKLCPKAFPTVARLKSHQLTHSHLPKFYCDQCAYFSLRSSDLIQHYTAEHNSTVNERKINHMEKPTSTTDRSRIYSCDMCLFETVSCGQLRVHYSIKHLIQPTEVQLRPSWTNDPREKNASTISATSDGSNLCIPLGITYPPMASEKTTETTQKTTTTTTMVQQQQPGQATTTAVLTPAGEINVVVDATSLFYSGAAARNEASTITTAASGDSNTFAIFPEQSFANTLTKTKTGPLAAGGSSVVNPNSSIFGDMQEFIDNTDVAAICTIPADDMPAVDGDDIVIDNNNISLDFDAENLFDDFEEDVEVGEDDEDDEEEAENDDENDNNDAAADQNLLLTSDDDDVDDFDDEQSKHLQKPYCIYCNKKFTSQYKFENHMFVHRGLAPYRCELCTNLYNMKRLLIRHYKTVHKRMPTRDMVQAKGDKVSVPCTAIEKLNFNVDKPSMLMCAKCPFECELENEMRKHLNAHHGINDGVSLHANEVFIIRKLPYECPRCIRSFAAKRTLTRHLQRSHLVDTIIEMQAPQLTTSSAATATTSTATITLSKNASDVNKTAAKTTHSEDGPGDGDGNGKCVDKAVDKDVGMDSGNSDANVNTGISLKKDINLATTARAKTTTAVTTEDSAVTEASQPTITKTAATSSVSTTTTETTPTTAAERTSLFPTPTPFDFDLDFIGNGAHATPIKTNNDSFSVVASAHQLLNGSDKLLSAALEPSPVKDLRSRLPRTPIFVCKQCNQTFDELSKLLQHESAQHSNDTVSPRSSHQHQCKICNSTYRTVTLLNYHMKKHAPRKLQCKLCPKEFELNLDLDEHLQSEHRTKMPLKCGIDGCKKTFNFKHHLKRHQTASHTRVQYICPECGRDMLTSLHLRNHMSSHKGTHSYKCPKCVRTYMRRNPFRRHALREHQWELTDAEIDKIYSENDAPIKRERRSLRVENDHSD